MKKKTVLTIAGSDSSGGAGIQADIKAITMNGVYASSVITALTAQNTTGVYGILETSADFIAAQMDAVFSDIFPDAVKIGHASRPRRLWNVLLPNSASTNRNILSWIRSWCLQADIV